MVNGDVLAQELISRMDQKFKALANYGGPLAQQDNSYYLEYCNAIGKGIVLGSPVIQFVTKDTGFMGAPFRVGTGVGLGIIVDKDYFTKKLYNEIRDRAIAEHGSTNHPAWCDEYDAVNDPFNPLPADHCSLQANQYNPRNFLTAMCEAVSETVTEHYAAFRILASTHPTIYAGESEIEEGGYLGIDPNSVASSIQGLAPRMQGVFWPSICQAIGAAYTDAIHNHSTGTIIISGICIPSESQGCGVPSVGIGTGTAS